MIAASELETKTAAVLPYNPPDYYLLDEWLSEEQKMIRAGVRRWVDDRLMPIIEDYAQRAQCPTHLIPEMGKMGIFGPFIPVEYGGAGLDQISYGLIMQELERCDSGIRSMASVQTSLVMYPIHRYGSEEQRRKYLPKLASGEWMGCFGLTEADYGSNPAGMRTHFRDMGDHYLLNGSKLWISNAPF
ncbi:MAG: acyl-CoA dehydrogenase family protein, partial [Bacteroidia bacterium]|nr:acyl-CoA dehydrogenase family protein [Bacteroidia bacterium]